MSSPTASQLDSTTVSCAHDALTREAFNILLGTIWRFYVPRALAGPLLPVWHTFIGSSSPFGMPRHTFEIKSDLISNLVAGPVNKIAKFIKGEFK